MSEKSIEFSCRCSSFSGRLHIPDNQIGFHVICYCCDCQKFNRKLESSFNKLDEHGGTVLYQTRPSFYKIDSGQEFVRCYSHQPNGLHRWYTACCNSHIANTMGKSSIPFIGIPLTIFKLKEGKAEENFGKIGLKAFAKYAEPKNPIGAHQTFPKSYMFKIIPFMIMGMIKGLAKPHPFYKKDGSALAEPSVGNLSITPT